MFKSGKKTGKVIWNLIGKGMVAKGYKFSGEQCDIKFRNLKKKHIKELLIIIGIQEMDPYLGPILKDLIIFLVRMLLFCQFLHQKQVVFQQLVKHLKDRQMMW